MTKTNKGDYSGYSDPDEIQEIKEEEKKVQELIGKEKRFFRLDFPNDEQSKEISASMTSARKAFKTDYVFKLLGEFQNNLMSTLSQRKATHNKDLGSNLFTPQVCTVIGYRNGYVTTEYSLRDLAIIMKDPTKVDIITNLIKSKKYTKLFADVSGYIQNMHITKTKYNRYDGKEFADEEPVKFKLGKRITIFSFADNKLLTGIIKEISIENGRTVTFIVDKKSEKLTEYVKDRREFLSFTIIKGQTYPTSSSDILQILFQLRDDVLRCVEKYVEHQQQRAEHNKKVYQDFRKDYLAELTANIL